MAPTYLEGGIRQRRLSCGQCAATKIEELAGEGTDTVLSSINFSIETLVNIENITLVDGATSATGNEGNNSLTGNDGASQRSLTAAMTLNGAPTLT